MSNITSDSRGKDVARLVNEGCFRADLLAEKLGITIDAANARLRRARIAGWVRLNRYGRYHANLMKWTR
jgi:hypothetical protein